MKKEDMSLKEHEWDFGYLEDGKGRENDIIIIPKIKEIIKNKEKYLSLESMGSLVCQPFHNFIPFAQSL